MIEHTLCSHAWRQLPLLNEENRYTGSRMDQCACNLKNRHGMLVLKPTRWKGSADILIRFLGIYRCTEDHPHGSVQGSSESGRLGKWTSMLGRAIIAGMALQQEVEHRYFGGKVVHGRIDSHDAFPAEDVEVPYDPPTSAITCNLLLGIAAGP